MNKFLAAVLFFAPNCGICAVTQAEPANIVEVVTVPAYGRNSPINFAMNLLSNPNAYDERLAEIKKMDWWESGAAQAALDVSVKFRKMFSELEHRGYEINHRPSATGSDLVAAIQNSRAAAVFHEGHTGVRENPDGNPTVRFVFPAADGGDVALDSETLRKLEQMQGGSIRPSTSLKLIFTGGCRAAYGEAFYRKEMNLPDHVKWMAGVNEQNAFSLEDRLAGKEGREILELLGPIEMIKERSLFDSK